jgi:hypothetical protein
MTDPLISVVLPVYNGAADVEKAVRTILAQTFTDFELIIINDGSKDHSASVLETLQDPRIRLYHQDNMGLAATLNLGIGLARGAYIARQDQDDLSHPERLAQQLGYMQSHADCVLLGTAAEIWVGDTPTERAHDHPTEHPVLAFDLLFNNPFVHSSVMMRREAVRAIGGYTTDKARQPPEDYELWSRMARHGRVANLSGRLLVYREVAQSMSRSGPNPFLDRLVSISAENLAFANGLPAADTVMVDVAAMTHSALHRLSRKPNIRAMTAAVEGAGARLAEGRAEVLERAVQRSNILRYQWTLQCTKAQWALPWLRRVRGLSRRLGIFK